MRGSAPPTVADGFPVGSICLATMRATEGDGDLFEQGRYTVRVLTSAKRQIAKDMVFDPDTFAEVGAVFKHNESIYGQECELLETVSEHDVVLLQVGTRIFVPLHELRPTPTDDF